MVDATHCLVAGSSGSGKTVLARQMHANFSGISVFLTPKEHEPVLENDAPASVVQTHCKYDSDIELVHTWAKERPEKVQIVVDECQMSGLKDGTGVIVKGLHFDRDNHIKWVLVTQSPQDLSESYSALQQCKRIYWVGAARTFHTGFLRYYQLSDIDFPEQYEWIRITPSIPPEVAGPFDTKRRYAD